MGNFKISPFVKWAGGKRQLLSQIKERMPKEYNELPRLKGVSTHSGVVSSVFL